MPAAQMTIGWARISSTRRVSRHRPATPTSAISVVVIAVPTSVGYGVAEGGRAALDAVLASCAPGIAVARGAGDRETGPEGRTLQEAATFHGVSP
jgi:hypothetical protein